MKESIFDRRYRMIMEEASPSISGPYRCSNAEFFKKFGIKDMNDTDKLSVYNQNPFLDVFNITKYAAEGDASGNYWIYYLDKKANMPAACMYVCENTAKKLSETYSTVFIKMIAALVNGEGLGAKLLLEAEKIKTDFLYLKSYSSSSQESLNRFYRSSKFGLSEVAGENSTFFFKNYSVSQADMNRIVSYLKSGIASI